MYKLRHEMSTRMNDVDSKLIFALKLGEQKRRAAIKPKKLRNPDSVPSKIKNINEVLSQLINQKKEERKSPSNPILIYKEKNSGEKEVQKLPQKKNKK